MIEPVLKHEALLDDIRSAAEEADAQNHFRLWWLGQSGFLLQWQQTHLLLDPYLSDSLTRKYADTDKPHVRMTECPIDPRRLDFIDVATSSHNHTDHLDRETLLPLCEANPTMRVLVPEANLDFAAARLELPRARFRTIDAGDTITSGPFRISAVPAAHEQLRCNDEGQHEFLGYVVEFGEWCVYHSGDTVRYEEMTDWLSRWTIDVALLPINGSLPERRVAGNLWGGEAVQLAHDLGVRLVIPCHFEMFEFNTVTPDAFIAAAREQNQAHRVLRCGQRWSSNELPQ